MSVKSIAVKPKRTKQQVYEDLNLDQYPDDHFMELLESLGDSPYVEGPGLPEMLETWTPDHIKTVVDDFQTAKSVGDMLEQARLQSNLTMAQVADKLGVSKGRVNQLEHPEANLEVATLTRIAHAMGYEVTILLSNQSGSKFEVKL